MSPILPALLLTAGCVLSACQRTKAGDDSASREKPAPPPAMESESEAKIRVANDEKGEAAKATETEAETEALAPPQRKIYVVAALGDSITDARGGGGVYLDVLRERCPKSQFLNFGKGGDMTNQMRRRFETEVVPQIAVQQINALIVYGGVNDLYSDLTAGRKNDKIEEDLTKIYQLARINSLKVVAVTVSPWGGFTKYWNPRRGQNTQLLNSWILGQEVTGLVDEAVDSFALLSCGDPHVLCPDYETRFHDGIHPGKQGHTVLGEKLVEEAFSDCL